MGRHNDYKSDPTCIHISDLKVPKVYLSIIVGTSDPKDLKTSSLSIKFESICKTTVNDELFRLPSRESSPMTKEFHEQDLLLKVNAHKTNRIQIRIHWVPVNVMPFSKKIRYEGEIQESPLPQLLDNIHAKGIDLRICNDPLLATHYIVLSDHVDFAYQIAVLRSIPVVTSHWTDCLMKTPHDINKWLFHPTADLLLPGTPSNYVFPDKRRPSLLEGKETVIWHLENMKQVTRLESWLKCLGCSVICLLNDQENKTSALTTLQRMVNTNAVFVFKVSGTDNLMNLFGEQVNLTNDLWNAVKSVDIKNLKSFTTANPEVEITGVKDEDTPRFSQRRKRRKVERVNDTDFFQFSYPSSSITSHNAVTADNENSQLEIEMPSQSNVEGDFVGRNTSEDEENKTRIESTAQQDAKQIETGETNIAMQNSEQQEKPSGDASQNADSVREPQEEPVTKKFKVNKNAKWIVPQISFADAVRATKEEAEKSAKHELETAGDDFVHDNLLKLAIVEEVDFAVPRKTKAQANVDPRYKGRPNFKAFRRRNKAAHTVTRTFLELYEDDSLNEIRFTDHGSTDFEAAERIEVDFAKEMNDVKGYQPKISQLFVDEASDTEIREEREDADYDDNTFSFTTRGKSTDVLIDSAGSHDYNDGGDGDGDDFKFAFSRR